MESQKAQSVAPRGSVQIKNSNGRLQLVFSHLIMTPTGELKTKRFYLSTGYYDTPLGRHQASALAAKIQRDIDYGEFDASLAKYKPAASLSTVSPITPSSPSRSGDHLQAATTSLNSYSTSIGIDKIWVYPVNSANNYNPL